MRKLYTLAFCISLFSTADAQISVGAKMGVDLCKEHFTSDLYSNSAHTRFNAGAFVNYKTALPISLQLELFYAGEGTNEKYIFAGVTGHIKEGYFNIPLLVQYKTAFGAYAETGPQLGFLLSSKETFNNVTDDIKQYYKKADFSWCFGLGYELQTTPVKGLGLNIRYSPGFTKINKVAVGGGDLKNRVFSIDLTYRLQIRAKKGMKTP